MNSHTHLLGLKDRERWCLRNSPYFELVKYLAPVALTLIAIDVGEQALNRSLASSFNAVNNLAGFGISYVMVRLATGMLSEIKMVSIMLLHNHSDRIRIGICVLVGGCLIFVCSLVISFSRFGYYLIDALHRVPPNVSQIAKDSILYLSVFPLIDGFAWLHAGVLLRFKYSLTVGGASLLDNIVQVITVVVMLNTRASRSNPLLIPVLATYFGTLVRLLTVVVAYYKYIHHRLHSYGLFDGQEGVAVLSVCYPIGHLPYGWLNTLRSIEPAFIKKLQESEAHVTVKNMRIFHLCCFVTTCILMVVLFCIPGVAPAILAKVSNVDHKIIRDAVVVLYVYCLFPVPVAIRAILTGMFVAQKSTKYLYPSIPTRLIALVSMLFILPRLGIHGSLMGMLALISGLFAESLCSLIIAFILYMRSDSIARNINVKHGEADRNEESKI